MTETGQVNVGGATLSWNNLAVIIILGFIGIASLYMGFENYGIEDEYFMIYVLLGVSCFAAIGYFFFKKDVAPTKSEIPSVNIVTVLECSSCNLKRIRDFKTGDYINKDDEPCTRCDGNMRIIGIHKRSDPKEKKN